MQIEYKKLSTPEELNHIRSIASEIWPQTFADILSAEQIRYMMQMMYAPEVMEKELANGMIFELICINGTPSGYMVYSSYTAPETAKLHKLYLLSGFHGCGLGQQMLDHVQKQCREAGFANLLLTVNKNNKRAIKAYLRNGFTITDSVCTPIGSGFYMDDYIMQKSLKNGK